MEKVQFQLEATLPELKDLHEKGLFSRTEINQITKRRTAHESALIRKGNAKEDFFKYAEYEIGLESLRRIRWKRLGYDKDPPPPSASTFSIPRRVMYILKRATVKYPADLVVWLAYVEYAGRERMRKIVSKGLNNALQHHPLSPTLYLLSSFHHLHPSLPFPRSAIPASATLNQPPLPLPTPEHIAGAYAIEGTQPARTTLLLGLRLLPRSHALWREYVKLELGWVEVLRRRWQVLGIGAADGDGANGMDGGEGAFGEEGEEARKRILAGELVLQAIRSALEGIRPEEEDAEGGGMAFREGLVSLLRAYPSPLRLRTLQEVYEEMERYIADSGAAAGRGTHGAEVKAKARLLLLTRELYDRAYDPADAPTAEGEEGLQGVECVEALGRVGKAIRTQSKGADGAFKDLAGKWVHARIGECGENAELRAYLLSILASLAKPSSTPTPSPALILLHLSHLPESSTARSALLEAHAKRHPSDPSLQLLRTSDLLSSTTAAPADTRRAMQDITRAVAASGAAEQGTADARAVRDIWTEWVQWEVRHGAGEAEWRALLKQSMGLGGAAGAGSGAADSDREDEGDVHSAILALYFSHVAPNRGAPLVLREIRTTYAPRPAFYAGILESITPGSATERDRALARDVYEGWLAACAPRAMRRGRETKGQSATTSTSASHTGADEAGMVRAALAYASWLLRAQRGREAGEVIRRARGSVGERFKGALDEGWAGICARVEREADAGDDEEEGEGEGEDVDMEDGVEGLGRGLDGVESESE